MRPRWLIELDPDFPGPEQVLRSQLVELIELEPGPPWAPSWPDVPLPAVAYGTMRTMRRLQGHAPLAPAVFDHYPSLRWTSFLPQVYDLLGREVFIVPLSALAQIDLRRHFGDRFFVRPETNYKLFAAQVVPCDEAASFFDFHRDHGAELVVLSEVVALGDEYRCFCRQGEVFCHSSYPHEPYSPAPPDVVAFAAACARRLYESRSLRMISVDVARAPDGRLRLVEIGGVNSWGVYGCDLPAFVAAMEAEAWQAWEDRQCLLSGTSG